jgi:uncharacterized protein (TIGR03083 family)
MDHATYLDHLRADADLLVSTGAGVLDRRVPTCPDWTVEQLVGHVGRVHRRAASYLTAGAPSEIEAAPEGAAVVGWTRTGTAELLAALEARAGSDEPVASWAGTRPAGFWHRRMAIETVLHRCDAQSAAGGITPVDTALAIDAVDEMFDVVLPFRPPKDLDAGGETIHLHATDPEPDLGVGGGEWLITLSGNDVAVERRHAKGDVAVRGAASDLLLLLYGRVGPERCEVFGDATLIDRWRAAVNI